MGKAQSKRSVDITTEVGKDGVAIEEGANKIGKIEDIDQLKPQINGDANHKDAAEDKENKDVKKKDEEAGTVTEEKEIKAAALIIENGASGDAAPKVIEKPVENGSASATEIAVDAANATATTLDDSKVSEVVEATESGDAAAPAADGADGAAGGDAAAADSQKKPKKEKTKKRWSFRSFSFSKKDKQKPEKKKKDEEAANDTAAVTNGDCDKVLEESVEEAVAGADKTVEAATAAVESVVNSDAAKTNGTAETRNDESAAADEPKPAEEIKQVIEQTIEEAVKSVGELKINVVSKAEKNGVEKSPEKENPAEISATESVNGDSAHKTIDEIIPSPEKLEKVAAIQKPTAEAIATE